VQNETLSGILAAPYVIYPLVALLSALVGWFLSRSLQPTSAVARPRPDASDTDQVRDLTRKIKQLEDEASQLSIFLMTLPDLARQLNDSNIEKRKIPPLLVSSADRLFDAEQILVFMTATGGRSLVLAAGKGAPDDANRTTPIPFGQGPIGWVAAHKVAMDEADFRQRPRDPEAEPLVRVPSVCAELCAPMVWKGQTLGVISIGGLKRRQKYEKNMLKMVADLGSIAMQNTALFQEIQQNANSDGLTGLTNKRHLMERLADELLKAEKERTSLSLFLFDIDHFKTYNDTNGHLAGDEALKITGRLLHESVRSDDIAARYGGEEFAVLLPRTDKNGAMTVAEKVRAAIESYGYPKGESQPSGRVTISGGVATYPYDALTSADLIRCADQALYECKRQGRNRVAAHVPRYLSDETGEVRTEAATGKA